MERLRKAMINFTEEQTSEFLSAFQGVLFGANNNNEVPSSEQENNNDTSTPENIPVENINFE